jgi:hypothetical protein
MLQPDARLPDVPLSPAPWDLSGSGWIIALRLPPDSPARDAFLPAGLAGRGRGLASFLMFVDYAESGCGPYRELLFIPGTFPFEDGRRHLSIGRILVSTWDSVVNGRNNWGIPKDRADFEVEQGGSDGREERVQVTTDGRELCELSFGTLRFAPPLPVRGALLPVALRTLAQFLEARGLLGLARPARGRIERLDLDLEQHRVVAADARLARPQLHLVHVADRVPVGRAVDGPRSHGLGRTQVAVTPHAARGATAEFLEDGLAHGWSDSLTSFRVQQAASSQKGNRNFAKPA